MNSVTIVYKVVDEEAFQKSGNPLRYEHHGLKAHTVAAYDAVYELKKLRQMLADGELIHKSSCV